MHPSMPPQPLQPVQPGQPSPFEQFLATLLSSKQPSTGGGGGVCTGDDELDYDPTLVWIANQKKIYLDPKRANPKKIVAPIPTQQTQQTHQAQQAQQAQQALPRPTQ